MIKGAPHYAAGRPLSEEDEHGLYSYYGLGPQGNVDRLGGQVDTNRTGDAGRAGEYLTRSEEHLHVGTEKVQTGRARLRKYVVTENQTATVPVTRQEAHVVREPMSPGDPVDDATIGEAEIDVTLTEDRVAVQKQTVPVEKVRLGTETVTEQKGVTEPVRKEQIDYENGTTDSRQ
jgi:uncharacterized protein (TIGR02271 family)